MLMKKLITICPNLICTMAPVNFVVSYTVACLLSLLSKSTTINYKEEKIQFVLYLWNIFERIARHRKLICVNDPTDPMSSIQRNSERV